MSTKKSEKDNHLLHLTGVGAALAAHLLTMNNKVGHIEPLVTLNEKDEKNIPKIIPKIIHQIWIGTTPPPLEWINSWISFCKQYNWVHILWDNQKVEEFLPRLVNQTEYTNSTSFQQKSDILRYEIMLEYGGIYIDCDMIWLELDLSLYINLNDNFFGVQEPISSAYGLIGSPFLANGFLDVFHNVLF